MKCLILTLLLALSACSNKPGEKQLLDCISTTYDLSELSGGSLDISESKKETLTASQHLENAEVFMAKGTFTAIFKTGMYCSSASAQLLKCIPQNMQDNFFADFENEARKRLGQEFKVCPERGTIFTPCATKTVDQAMVDTNINALKKDREQYLKDNPLVYAGKNTPKRNFEIYLKRPLDGDNKSWSCLKQK